MRLPFIAAVSLVAVVTATPLVRAQTPPTALAVGNTVLLSEYECDASQLTRVDALVAKLAAPILDKHIAAGRILTWGWMGVHLGGKANRSFYLWAKDPVALAQARAVYLPEITGQADWTEVAKLCGSPQTALHNLLLMPGQRR
jgi:hypothetical protein